MSHPIAVVTGASRGIGRAISIALAKSGFSLILVGRDDAALRATSDLCDAHSKGSMAPPTILVGDLLNSAFVDEIYDAIAATGSALHVLVNNAGVGGGGKILEVGLQRWLTCVETNFMSMMRLTHRLAPFLAQAKGSALINIGSVASKTTYGGGAAYASSKHAVLGFTGCIFEDLREFGVKVSTICPGFVDTEMVDALSKLDRQKMIAPEDVAEAVMYVVHSSARCCPTEITLRPQFTPYV